MLPLTFLFKLMIIIIINIINEKCHDKKAHFPDCINDGG